MASNSHAKPPLGTPAKALPSLQERIVAHMMGFHDWVVILRGLHEEFGEKVNEIERLDETLSHFPQTLEFTKIAEKFANRGTEGEAK